MMKPVIFLVEDDNMIGMLLENTLMSNGNFSVFRFESGEECIENMHLNPDVVVLDYYLPGMNGSETLVTIKALDSSCEVIMVSSQKDVGLASKLLNEGALRYIPKGRETLVDLQDAVDEGLANQAWQRRRMKISIPLMVVVLTVAIAGALVLALQ